MRAILICVLWAASSCVFRDVSNVDLTEDILQPEVGEHIVICGERFRTGAPVVLWTDEGGYDATSTELFFGPPPRGVETPTPGSLRYAPGRKIRTTGRVLVAPDSNDLLALQSVVDQFVLHYDVCGVSETCFKVLHDRRGLSVHFMIDIDGTIYQTMDLRDTAWHASQANTRSIGVELANIGAYALGDREGMRVLESWYADDTFGKRIVVPESIGRGGVLSRGFVGRPARQAPVRGPVQGATRVQYDYTPEQYDSLVRLTAALCRAFPKLRPAAPVAASGRVRTDVLSEEELRAHQGVIGHHHISAAKLDPGPAFDWERFLARVRTRLAAVQP